MFFLIVIAHGFFIWPLNFQIDFRISDIEIIRNRSSRSQMIFKVNVLKSFVIFTGKHLCSSSSWQSCSLIFNIVCRWPLIGICDIIYWVAFLWIRWTFFQGKLLTFILFRVFVSFSTIPCIIIKSIKHYKKHRFYIDARFD